MAKKKITEIRDDIFFRKLLDVSKNAVFIGWAGVYRKEYQSLLKDNLPHLRELSIIENAGFESTSINVALYVFSEETTDTYISRVYDADKVVHEETFSKDGEIVEYAKKPVPPKDLRPKMSDFFKTFYDYKVFESKQALGRYMEEIKVWESGKGPIPWENLKEEKVDWEKGGNAMMSDFSFRNYLKSVQYDLDIFSLTGDISILEVLAVNLATLAELGRKIQIQLEVLRTVGGSFDDSKS